MSNQQRSLEEDLMIVHERVQKVNAITIGELLQILSDKGRLIILIFLALPFCQPLLLPGLSTPFGFVIALIGLRMAIGKEIWLPKKLLQKEITAKVMSTIASKSLTVFKKLQRVIHIRWPWLCEHGVMKYVNGVLVFLIGFYLFLPIPIPFTGMPAAWALVFLSLGLLENDGLFVILGYLLTAFTFLLFVFLFFSLKSIF